MRHLMIQTLIASAELLGSLVRTHNFIIVNHNKRTMESTNAMYGVTMEEEGVSKLVSVRFNEQTAAQLS